MEKIIYVIYFQQRNKRDLKVGELSCCDNDEKAF
jgi:hypothetical protein